MKSILRDIFNLYKKKMNFSMPIKFVNKRIVENKKNELVKVNEEISKKSKQLQILFDNIEQGFLLFSDDLIIEDQYSNECIKIFGEDISKKYYPEFIYPDDQEQRQLLEKVLKKALSLNKTNAGIYLSLLADELELNGKQIQVHYKIIDNETINKYMVILKDITDKRSLENKMVEEKNTLRMILQAVVYYNDFFECIRDYQNFCENRIYQIIEEEENQNTALIKIFKCLHTFKGNFYQLHMKNIAEMIHTFEDKLANLYDKMDSMTKYEIINYFKMVNMQSWLDKEIAILKEILGEKFFRKENILMIDSLSLSELEDNYYSILSESQCEILIPEIRRLRYKPIKEMFEIYKIHVERLTTKLYKSVNPLKISGGDMLVCPEIYSGFIKSLVHIFRNTMDHGIESVEERLEIGKDAFGNIYCDIHTFNDKLIIIIADDGSGINLNNIKVKAIEKGIYSKERIEQLSDEDIIKLIFKEQFSTCNKIGDLSGRGLGLSAVKNEIDKLGGTIEVTTKKNLGTKFKFLLPYKDINYIKETPAKTIIDYFVEKVTVCLKNDLHISLQDCQYSKIKLVDIINLNKHTITLRVIEEREYLFVLSADTKMALKILYNVYIGEITEKVDRYIEDALSEMLNVVVGNIIKIIFKNSDDAIMDTPMVISDIGQLDNRGKYKWQYDINSDIGNLKLALLLSEK